VGGPDRGRTGAGPGVPERRGRRPPHGAARSLAAGAGRRPHGGVLGAADGRGGATLLPFRGRIVYDGFHTGPGLAIHFGGGARRSFEDSYREAKAAYGVITSLPHDVAPDAEAPDEAAKRRLKTLVRSQRSRRLHWAEIQDLRDRSPEPERVYHQERGKADARSVGRSLRELGIEQGWFALYEGLVVASAGTREKLARRVREVLPASKRDLPYLYHLKRRR